MLKWWTSSAVHSRDINNKHRYKTKELFTWQMKGVVFKNWKKNKKTTLETKKNNYIIKHGTSQ